MQRSLRRKSVRPPPNKSPLVTSDSNSVAQVSVYYQNSRGLCSKHKRFFCTSTSYDHDVIILTETWLKKELSNAEFFDDSYNVYRKDRSIKRGGGVLIALKNELLSSEQIDISDAEDLEYVCIKAKAKSHNIYIYCAYIPPNSSAEIYLKHLAAIHSIAMDPEDVLIIVGDYNLPHVQWTTDDADHGALIPTAFDSSTASDFINGLLGMGVHQVNSIRNANNRLLDLLFTNDFTNVSIDHAKPLTRVDEHHPPILATFEWHEATNDSMTQPKIIYNFKRANFKELNSHLASINFTNLFKEKVLCEKVHIFHEVLNSAIKRFVPTIVTKPREKCPWNNKKLQQLKNKKNKEWKRSKRTGDKQPFELAFQEFDVLNTTLYNNYVDKLKSSLKQDPASFWRFVNSKKSTDNKPKVLQYDSHSTADEVEQANLFAKFFGSNYTVSSIQNGQQTQHQSSTQNQHIDFELNQNFVLEELSSINVKKGIGPDGIHPLILKNCAHRLAAPLTELFNESLSQGLFPDQWKRSSVTPIFKKGARSKIENYRCIAKLQTVAKFFEHLVNVKLLTLVHDKIALNQHGFMRSRSTASNLTEFVYFAQKSLNSGSQVDVLYTDFSKAFDRVSHDKLIAKLSQFNLPANLIAWLKSYLSDRTQFVKYGNSESTDFNASSGVPQGSHLGPTLFLLFINDIVDGMDDVFISLFADDVKIARAIKSTEDVETLQIAIDKLRAWCNENELHLNLDKCSVLTIYRGRAFDESTYTYGDHIFNRVREHKDLGVIMDEKLLFAKHIDAIKSKATAALGFVKRFCYDITDVQTLKALYYSLVQSHLEYCSVVWLPFDKIYKEKIESVLRQFTMFARKEYPSATNNYKITSYTNRLAALEMATLERRRINTSIVFMYDVIQGSANCPNIREDLAVDSSSRILRRNEYIKIIDKDMKLALKSPVPQMCKNANKVVELFSNASTRKNFISRLRNTSDNVFV